MDEELMHYSSAEFHFGSINQMEGLHELGFGSVIELEDSWMIPFDGAKFVNHYPIGTFIHWPPN